MSLKSKILRSYFARREAAIDRFRRHPHRVQEQMLRIVAVTSALGLAILLVMGLIASYSSNKSECVPVSINVKTKISSSIRYTNNQSGCI